MREKYGGGIAERLGPTLAAAHFAAEDGDHGGSRTAASLAAGGGAGESGAEAQSAFPMGAGRPVARRAIHKGGATSLPAHRARLLVMDATGLDALVSQEQCTSIQDSQPDGTCPALCVRCACCAQPIVPEIAASDVSMSLQQPVLDLYCHKIPRSVPSKIFHVPKFASSTI